MNFIHSDSCFKFIKVKFCIASPNENISPKILEEKYIFG